MKNKIDSYEYDINNMFSISEFRKILDQYENTGATHLKLSYQDYGNPFVELFVEVKAEAKEIPVTYATIKRCIGWSTFAEETNRNVYAINEFGEYPPNKIFYITKTQAENLKL